MNFFTTLQTTLRQRFSLWTGKEAGTHTISEAKANISFQGANLWILLLAIVICSIGLNMNSTPVVIGAMLLSPLMGPILGLGVGLAIFDMDMVGKGLRNIIGAFVFSIVVSGLYFFLSPLQDATPEIIARTSPTMWDILIALSGGIIGAIALTRKEKGYTVIPGVAIATALMPPLCTVGYWLVQGDIITALKAFYLLFINTIYIAGATFLVARLVSLPKKVYLDTSKKKQVEGLIWAIIIITAIPGIRLTHRLLQESLLEQQFHKFVHELSQEHRVEVLQQTIDKDKKNMNIRIVGSYLDIQQQNNLKEHLSNYSSLHDYSLSLRQGVGSDPLLGEKVVQPLLEQARESQESKTLSMIQKALQEYSSQVFQPEQVLLEAKALDEDIVSLAFELQASKNTVTSGSSQGHDLQATIVTQRLLLLSKKKTIEHWLRTRIQQPLLVIVWKVESSDSNN